MEYDVKLTKRIKGLEYDSKSSSRPVTENSNSESVTTTNGNSNGKSNLSPQQAQQLATALIQQNLLAAAASPFFQSVFNSLHNLKVLNSGKPPTPPPPTPVNQKQPEPVAPARSKPTQEKEKSVLNRRNHSEQKLNLVKNQNLVKNHLVDGSRKKTEEAKVAKVNKMSPIVN